MTRPLFLACSILMLVILLSGCLGQDEESKALFVGGDKALEFKFSGSAPPSEVRANEPFEISILVENKGESGVGKEELVIDLSNGAIFNLSEADFIKLNKEELAPIIKQDVDFLPGGVTYINYAGLKYVGSEVITEESPIAISLEACYAYHTTTISTICVAKEADSSKVCQPLGEKKAESSGAPIKVKLLDQQSNGIPSMTGLSEEEKATVTSRVKVEFSKSGEQRIYPSEFNCITKESLGGEGFTIKSIKVDNIAIDAKEACGDDTVFLDSDGNAKAICSLKIPEVPGDYEGRLEIVLEYRVSEVLNKEISILPY